MKKLRIILILLLVLNLFQYNFWHLWHNMFFHLEYVQFSIFWAILYQLNDKWAKLITTEGMIFCANDIVDMVYFDPQKFEWNEVVFCLIALIFLYGTSRRKRVGS